MQFGLSFKLIGYVVAGVLMTSAAIGVVRVQNERGPLSDLIGKAGQSVANATASGAASLIAGYDYGNLEILADNISQQANVIRVIIRNQGGRIMSEAYSGVREEIFHLRAITSMEAGFLPTLQTYLANYRKYFGMEVSLQADRDAAEGLTGNVAMQVIRVVQEALSNVHKHARTSHARVQIDRTDESVRVCIEDDGQGYDLAQEFGDDQPHYGLQSMRERAEKVGGRLAVDSQPGGGTRVELRVPYSQERGLQ